MTAQYSLSPRPSYVVLLATAALLLMQALLQAEFTPPSAPTLPASLWGEMHEELRAANSPVTLESSDELLTQAWLAGGGQADQLPRLRSKVREWQQAVRRDLNPTVLLAERATALHHWLHQHVLLTYDAGATDLSRVLNRGEYNCVSATLLYVVLARELQLPAATLCRGQHCRVGIRDGASWLPLETTCATCQGLSPLKAPVQPVLIGGDPNQERLLNEQGLVGLFWFNRAIDELKAKQHRAAVAANLVALSWDLQNADARTNLLASLNYLGLDAAKVGDFTVATRWLMFAGEVNPNDPTTQHNRRYVEGLVPPILIDLPAL
jgi:tetratricopeptide (TPR) repeat protein